MIPSIWSLSFVSSWDAGHCWLTMHWFLVQHILITNSRTILTSVCLLHIHSTDLVNISASSHCVHRVYHCACIFHSESNLYHLDDSIWRSIIMELQDIGLLFHSGNSCPVHSLYLRSSMEYFRIIWERRILRFPYHCCCDWLHFCSVTMFHHRFVYPFTIYIVPFLYCLKYNHIKHTQHSAGFYPKSTSKQCWLDSPYRAF